MVNFLVFISIHENLTGMGGPTSRHITSNITQWIVVLLLVAEDYGSLNCLALDRFLLMWFWKLPLILQPLHVCPLLVLICPRYFSISTYQTKFIFYISIFSLYYFNWTKIMFTVFFVSFSKLTKSQ